MSIDDYFAGLKATAPAVNKSVFNNVKKPKKPKGKLEEALQRAMVKFLTPFMARGELYVFAVPNGGSRNKIEASHLKLGGVRAGVADLVVLLPNGVTKFLEVKAPELTGISSKTGKKVIKAAEGEQSESQKEFEASVKALGFEYHIVKSVVEVAAVVGLSDYVNPVYNFVDK